MSGTDLRGRRIALGASEEVMATGMGLRLSDLLEIERLEASDAALNHYATWLSEMEQWSADYREQQFVRARTGFFFVRKEF